MAVFEDELLLNQLRKLIETNDDTEEGIVGTKDGSLNILSWTPDMWNNNKTGGKIQNKVLFLGPVKGTEDIIPLIDIKFDKHGVQYGWAGNQAVVLADPGVLKSRKDYDAFLEELNALPVPKIIKIEPKQKKQESKKMILEEIEEPIQKFATHYIELPHEKLLREIREIIVENGQNLFGKIAEKSEEMFRDKKLVKRQMMFYGIVNLYNNDLEEFVHG